jgi:hypothetical protein
MQRLLDCGAWFCARSLVLGTFYAGFWNRFAGTEYAESPGNTSARIDASLGHSPHLVYKRRLFLLPESTHRGHSAVCPLIEAVQQQQTNKCRPHIKSEMSLRLWTRTRRRRAARTTIIQCSEGRRAKSKHPIQVATGRDCARVDLSWVES